METDDPRTLKYDPLPDDTMSPPRSIRRFVDGSIVPDDVPDVAPHKFPGETCTLKPREDYPDSPNALTFKNLPYRPNQGVSTKDPMDSSEDNAEADQEDNAEDNPEHNAEHNAENDAENDTELMMEAMAEAMTKLMTKLKAKLKKELEAELKKSLKKELKRELKAEHDDDSENDAVGPLDLQPELETEPPEESFKKKLGKDSMKWLGIGPRSEPGEGEGRRRRGYEGGGEEG